MTWTYYHEWSLNLMLNREVRVAAHRRDGPLIDRIRKAIKYLVKRKRAYDAAVDKAHSVQLGGHRVVHHRQAGGS